jgi:monoamine oxidase
VSQETSRLDPTKIVPRVSKTAPTSVDTAIIGGGIAGLYCGYMLGKKNLDFLIAESTQHLGGRIWSTRIPEASDHSSLQQNRVEFCAEFGPMRLELELQIELGKLLLALGFKRGDYEPFPPYESPTSEHDPKYEMNGEEREQSTPFDLLILAVVRIFGRLRIEEEKKSGAGKSNPEPPGMTSLKAKLNEMLAFLSRSTLTRQPTWQKSFVTWVKTLGESDYQNLREFGIFDDGTKNGTPLWNMGFWNLLSEVLSHHAVMKIRDLGAFYHLIPENPNGAEWLIFWLRGLRTSEAMVGIRGGMQCITEKIVEKIDPNKIKKGQKLVSMQRASDGSISLQFENGEEWKAKRVILAMPKAPLEELVKANEQQFYEGLHRDLDAVFSFPMLKLFLIVKERWWSEDFTRTNRYATLVPSREIHYKSSPLEGSKRGLILLYTDRPATTFWANYVKTSGAQSEPEIGGPDDNPRLIDKALQYLKEYGVQTRGASDIPFYGIRDWGREPYGGANHAWRPERQSWMILKKLSGFPFGRGLSGEGTDEIHVCGEAYSDYHGFIEGALRSAAHVLHRIDKKNFPGTPTEWLCDGSCVHPVTEKPH